MEQSLVTVALFFLLKMENRLFGPAFSVDNLIRFDIQSCDAWIAASQTPRNDEEDVLES